MDPCRLFVLRLEALIQNMFIKVKKIQSVLSEELFFTESQTISIVSLTVAILFN